MGLLLVMVARVFSEEASGKIICTRADLTEDVWWTKIKEISVDIVG